MEYWNYRTGHTNKMRLVTYLYITYDGRLNLTHKHFFLQQKLKIET